MTSNTHIFICVCESTCLNLRLSVGRPVPNRLQLEILALPPPHKAQSFSYNNTSYCFTERLSVLVFVLRSCKLKVNLLHRVGPGQYFRQGERGVLLCGVQGSLLNQYPPSDLNLETSFFFVGPKNKINHVFPKLCTQFITAGCVSLSFLKTLLPSVTVGSLLSLCDCVAILARIPLKKHFNLWRLSFLKKCHRKTQHALNVILDVVKQTADYRLTGDHICILYIFFIRGLKSIFKALPLFSLLCFAQREKQ